jgi:hypothetical protein
MSGWCASASDLADLRKMRPPLVSCPQRVLQDGLGAKITRLSWIKRVGYDWVAASKGKRTLNIQHRPAERATWLTVVCISVLLLATTIQAVHLCGLEIPNLRATAQVGTASFRGGACLTCLMAHSAAAAALVVVFSPTFRANKGVPLPEIRTRQLLESFHLYVRPPPPC